MNHGQVACRLRRACYAARATMPTCNGNPGAEPVRSPKNPDPWRNPRKQQTTNNKQNGTSSRNQRSSSENQRTPRSAVCIRPQIALAGTRHHEARRGVNVARQRPARTQRTESISAVPRSKRPRDRRNGSGGVQPAEVRIRGGGRCGAGGSQASDDSTVPPHNATSAAALNRKPQA